jgi:gephyrin
VSLQFLVPALKHGIDVLQDNKNKVEKNHQVENGHTCHHHHHHENNVNVASRPRKSPYPMITVQEAQAIVLHHCQNPIGIEEISFRQALGRVLAEDVLAKDPLPPFPASVKDGYAVLSSDKAGTRIVIGSSNAGNSPGQVLQAGQCVRINTGAPVPIGADAVVQVEDTELTKKSDDGKEEFEIEILEAPTVGQDIRPIGSDIQDGSVVLSKGSILGPAEIGLLATVGSTRLKGFKKPIIALLSTGNELQDPDQADLKPGFIRDSNKTTLWSLLDMEQGFSTVDCGIANDDLGDLKAKLTFALDHGDMIVTTGGVSMGDKDLLRQVLVQDFSAHIHFGRVLMKPGKPTTFATLTWKDKSKLILGLPGNPVSATVTSHLYVLPAARALSGYKKPFAATVKARLAKDLVLDPRPEYQRVALYWNGQDSVSSSEATGNQVTA